MKPVAMPSCLPCPMTSSPSCTRTCRNTPICRPCCWNRSSTSSRTTRIWKKENGSRSSPGVAPMKAAQPSSNRLRLTANKVLDEALPAALHHPGRVLQATSADGVRPESPEQMLTQIPPHIILDTSFAEIPATIQFTEHIQISAADDGLQAHGIGGLQHRNVGLGPRLIRPLRLDNQVGSDVPRSRRSIRVDLHIIPVHGRQRRCIRTNRLISRAQVDIRPGKQLRHAGEVAAIQVVAIAIDQILNGMIIRKLHTHLALLFLSANRRRENSASSFSGISIKPVICYS